MTAITDGAYTYRSYDGWENMPSAEAMEAALCRRIDAFAALTRAMREHPNVGRVGYYTYLVPRMNDLRQARQEHLRLEARVTEECLEHHLELLTLR